MINPVDCPTYFYLPPLNYLIDPADLIDRALYFYPKTEYAVSRWIPIYAVIFFAISSMAVRGIELDEFSENKKIFIQDISIVGNNIMTEKEILDIAEFDKKKGLFISDIRQGISRLQQCGYFSSVSFLLGQGENGYTLEIIIKENPPLASLNIIESKMLDLSVFRKKLESNKVRSDLVFSPAKLEKAIEEFNIYNQNLGIFLYIITYRVVTRNEIIKEGGTYLYEPADLQKNGIHVIVYIREIPRMTLGEIRMKNISVSYDDILNYLELKQGMFIEKDEDLYFRYKRLKKLGFYNSIYFKLIPVDAYYYKLEIQGEQISLSEISTSLTAPPNIGVIMSAEYYNIAVFNSMQRFRIGVGWELQVGAPIAVVEYTDPYFWKGLFVDLTCSKYDSVDAIQDEKNYKLSNNFDSTLTGGKNIFGNFYAYIFQKEVYTIAQLVDEKYKKLEGFDKTSMLSHSTGMILMYDDLDDNFFITQGFKLLGEYETLWQKPLAYKTQFSGELYVPVPFFNLIAAIDNRTNFLIADHKDKKTTLSLDTRMRTNVQEIRYIGEQQIKITTYSSAELRFPMPQNVDMFKDMSFVIFGEVGGAWSEYRAVSLQQTQFGIGIGFRLSPRKHYSSFLFQFPAGLYIGYRVGDTKPKTSLVSHRDQMYYINLTASF
jgi:outer membrane protein assembly factor BamA